MNKDSNNTNFDARQYWEKRFKGEYSLHGVGYLGLGQSFNTWRYKIKRSTFLKTVKSLHLNLPNLNVLDVGCGTGFYIELWKELKTKNISGIDITDTAIENMKDKFPEYEFACFNIGNSLGEFKEGSFDAVSAIAVLLHIVDDNLFKDAISNISTLLKPGGVFVFSDNFTHGPKLSGLHAVQRPLDETLRALDLAGFDVLFRKPMFYFMNNPVDTKSTILKHSWKAISYLSSKNEYLGYVVGMFLFPLEYAFTTIFSESPTTELMVCKKR